MPGLTIATGAHPASATSRGPTATRRRGGSAASHNSPSPSRPPVSPITPTFAPTQAPSTEAAAPAQNADAATSTANIPEFALGRPMFTHTTQTDQVAVSPPRAQPIDFESNPDVLALKSAISILQLQRNRAAADIQALSRARDAALAHPEEFVADLAAGRVRVEGDPLFSPSAAYKSAEADSDSDSSSDSDSDSDAKPAGENQQSTSESETNPPGGGGANTPTNGTSTTGTTNTTHPPPPNGQAATTDTHSRDRDRDGAKPKRKSKRKSKPARPPPPPWQTLPKPQSVVRCPPINWAQYGVVGESFDKLHAEQLAAPTPGMPAVLGPGGTFEFKAGAPGGVVPPGTRGSSSSGSGGGGGGGTDATAHYHGGSAPTHGGGGGGGGGGLVGSDQPQRLVGIAAPYNPLRDKVERKGRGGRR